MKYVVDTCVFNKLVTGELRPTDLPSDGRFVATHVQIDELNATADGERRARLFLMLSVLAPVLVPTESFLLDFSRMDHATLGSGRVFQSVRTALDSLNHGKANNLHDALIAEVAILNDFTLLTSDRDLYRVATQHGAKTQLLSASHMP